MSDKLPCEFCGFMHDHSNAWSPEHIAHSHNRILNLEAENRKSELSRLREKIEKAPHHIECDLTYRGPNGELSYCDEDLSLCTCWKHDAQGEGK